MQFSSIKLPALPRIGPAGFIAAHTILLFAILIQQSDCARAQALEEPHLADAEYIDAEYIDKETVAVGWVDITQLNIENFFQFSDDMGSSRPPAEQTARVISIQEALVQLKVKRIYIISDLGSAFAGPPQLVVPCENAQAVALFMGTVMGDQMYKFRHEGNVVLGDPAGKTLRQSSKSGSASAELIAAIKSCSGTHGLAIATPANVTMAAKTLFRPFADGQDVAQVVRDSQMLSSIQWISLSGDLPPQNAKLRVETNSPEAASALCEYVKSSVERLGEQAALLAFNPSESSAVMEVKSTKDAQAKLRAVRDLFRLGVPQVMNSMKQVGLALHNYHDSYQSLPPQSLVDGQGKRLLSWRVLILPFLEQQALYNEFRLDEPWDSPHNLKLAEIIPAPYASDLPASGGPQKTRILAALTKDSVFGRPGKPLTFSKILDGLSNTIWFVEAPKAQAVVWTKPDDLVIDEAAPAKSILSADADGVIVARVDGSVQRLERVQVSDELVKAMLTIDGQEPVDF